MEIVTYIQLNALNVLLGNKIYRGNRYIYGTEYGTMLLFDSNGDIAGIQAAVNIPESTYFEVKTEI